MKQRTVELQHFSTVMPKDVTTLRSGAPALAAFLASSDVLSAEDTTAAAESIARRWHDARAAHRAELVAREGESNFDGLQRFLACVHRLSAERRLSRFGYLAERC